ncbi:MAG TPA: hypothetical protein VGD99_24290 [Anaerolineae bacterium]
MIATYSPKLGRHSLTLYHPKANIAETGCLGLDRGIIYCSNETARIARRRDLTAAWLGYESWLVILLVRFMLLTFCCLVLA